VEVALDLWVRQIGLLALLAALGSGPAALLPGSVPAAARLALAPALGLAIGAAAGVSVAYLMPMTTGAWALMLPLTLASCGFATWRSRRARDWSWRPPGLQLALLAGLAVVVSGAANAPLLAEESLGPLGYTITDANYLVIQHDALEDASLRELEVPPPSAESEVAAGAVPTAPAPGTSPEDLDLLVDTVNTIPAGFASLAATTDVLFGWHAVDTQTPFLGVLLVVVALGGFAAVCMLSGSALAGAVTGLLLAGPVTYQLYVESGEGALSSIALLPAIATVGVLLLRGPTPALVVLFGLGFAGLSAAYGLVVPGVSLAVGLAVAVAAIIRRRAGELDRAALIGGAKVLGAAATLAVVLSPFAFARNVSYGYYIGFTDVIDVLLVIGLPRYELSVETVPAWILQTRELYLLPSLSDLDGVGAWALSVLAPLALLAVAALGAWHYRRQGALALLAIVPVAVLLALKVGEGDGCSYCAQRQLVIVEPVVAIMLGLGLVALAEGARRRGLGIVAPVAVVAIAGAALLLAADKSVVLAKRAAQGGYALDPGVRELLPELDAAGQTVRLEAGGAGTALPLELPATYYAIQQATDSNPGIDPLSSDYSTVADFGKSGRGPSGTNPGYELVLTRIGAVESQREVIAESGPYAVERRAHPFDVTVVNGVVADIAERDGTGRAWITGPLAFSVARDQPSAKASLIVEVEGPAAGELEVMAPAEIVARGAAGATICAPVPVNEGPIEMALEFEPLPDTPPPEQYGAAPVPGRGLELIAVRVAPGRCR